MRSSGHAITRALNFSNSAANPDRWSAGESRMLMVMNVGRLIQFGRECPTNFSLSLSLARAELGNFGLRNKYQRNDKLKFVGHLHGVSSARSRARCAGHSNALFPGNDPWVK